MIGTRTIFSGGNLERITHLDPNNPADAEEMSAHIIHLSQTRNVFYYTIPFSDDFMFIFETKSRLYFWRATPTETLELMVFIQTLEGMGAEIVNEPRQINPFPWWATGLLIIFVSITPIPIEAVRRSKRRAKSSV